MTEMGQIWWQKHNPSSIVPGATPQPPAAAAHPRRPSPSCCLRRLVRKLKKHGKMLCSAGRPAPFRCHYDPLSYARNFDHNDDAFGDGSDRFYAFSYRFAAAAAHSASPPAIAAAH